MSWPATLLASGLDFSDPLLRKALACRIVQALRLQWKQRQLGREAIRKGVRVCALNASNR